MSKLHRVKGWYSFEEAAARLSKSFSEVVTSADVVQLAAEGKIKSCWFLNGAHYARRVAVACAYPRDERFAIYSEPEYDKNGESWGQSLAGIFTLPVEMCPSWGWWLLTFIGKGGESSDMCGALVIADDGAIWELYDEKSDSSFSHFPRRDEVVFRRDDIESFERRVHAIDSVLPIDGQAQNGECRSDETAHLFTGMEPRHPLNAADMLGLTGQIIRNLLGAGCFEELRHTYGISQQDAARLLHYAELAELRAWGIDEMVEASLSGQAADEDKLRRRIAMAMKAESSPEYIHPGDAVLLLERSGLMLVGELRDAIVSNSTRSYADDRINFSLEEWNRLRRLLGKPALSGDEAEIWLNDGARADTHGNNTPPRVVPPGEPSPAKGGTTKHKLRTNSLDGPIQKAIQKAKSTVVGAVFLELREMALNGEAPFSGQVEGAALCYTKDDNKPGKLTKNALGKRLRNHNLQAVSRR